MVIKVKKQQKGQSKWVDKLVRWLEIIALSIFVSIIVVIFIQFKYQISWNISGLDDCLNGALLRSNESYESALSRYRAGKIEVTTFKQEIDAVYNTERLEIIRCMGTSGKVDNFFK